MLRCQTNTDLSELCQGWALPKPAAGPPQLPLEAYGGVIKGSPFLSSLQVGMLKH